MSTKKFCPGCNTNLYLKDFQNNASRYDGKQAYCRSCQNERIRRHGEKHPEKIRAKALVAVAIRHGDLTRATHCEACASTQNIDAHHDDYSKPLDVIWLCRSCHQKVHSDNMEIEASVRADLEGLTVDAFLNAVIRDIIERKSDEASA